MGAILAKNDENNKEYVIVYKVKTLYEIEKNYPIIEKKCLTVVWGIEKFKYFLREYIPFTVYTNHVTLRTMMK